MHFVVNDDVVVTHPALRAPAKLRQVGCAIYDACDPVELQALRVGMERRVGANEEILMGRTNNCMGGTGNSSR